MLERWRELIRPYYLRWIYFPVHPARRPSYFRDCWTYPNAPLAERSVPAGGAAPSFLFWPMADWHFRVQRTQHLAMALARRGHRCYVVNPHLGRQFLRPFPFDSGPRLSTVADNIHELHVRLPAEPVYHHRLLGAAESDRIADALQPLSCEKDIVQIVMLPTWMDAAERLRTTFGWRIVYDCHDAIAGFPNMAREIADAETAAMQSANLVVFSSDFLQQNATGLRLPRQTLIRNAAASDHLRSAAREQRSRPAAGYIGAIDEWFDIDWLTSALKAFPETPFLIAGTIYNPRLQDLSDASNLRLLGEVPYREVPRVLAEIDVGLIPFRCTELTRATNPIKLYEYFSHGIPVVASRLPEIERYRDLVYIADHADDFVAQIGNALNEAPGDARREHRIQVAKAESWDARADQLLKLLA
jgi:glycosyltransferase involved in cell wall biosynthesis